jgi:hypothetical protein
MRMSLSPLVLVVVVVLVGGSGRFARMEEEYMEKASGGTFARSTRNTDEDEG